MPKNDLIRTILYFHRSLIEKTEFFEGAMSKSSFNTTGSQQETVSDKQMTARHFAQSETKMAPTPEKNTLSIRQRRNLFKKTVSSWAQDVGQQNIDGSGNLRTF